jgi:hypothetical protein
MYLPEDAVIHDNIADALRLKVIERKGNPNGYDEWTYIATKYPKYPNNRVRFGIRIGMGN